MAWTCAPGNVAVESAAWPPWVWPTLSFPLLTVLPLSIANEWLYQACAANSVLWGLAAAGLTSIIASRIRRYKGRVGR
jgi:hypothetical protein